MSGAEQARSLTLGEALERARKFDDPTPDDLGLPSDQDQLWRMQYQASAPRAAWRNYYAAVGGAQEEAEERVRRRPRKEGFGGKGAKRR
jgi:hypothetical protein